MAYHKQTREVEKSRGCLRELEGGREGQRGDMQLFRNIVSKHTERRNPSVTIMTKNPVIDFNF